MYPRADVSPQPNLPSTAQFWSPVPDDIDEYEGFGFFGDVWTIVDVSEAEAREMFEKDHSICLLVSTLANNESEFDVLATTVETGVADDADEIHPNQLAALTPYLTDIATLSGLEIGV